MVRKFGETTSKWLEFWDPFERAINKNETLAKIDKFSYFEGFLIEQVRICPHTGKLQSRKHHSSICSAESPGEMERQKVNQGMLSQWATQCT